MFKDVVQRLISFSIKNINDLVEDKSPQEMSLRCNHLNPQTKQRVRGPQPPGEIYRNLNR